jgi:hypothetical protein
MSLNPTWHLTGDMERLREHLGIGTSGTATCWRLTRG